MLAAAVSSQSACQQAPPNNHQTSETQENTEPNTDIEGLRRLVNLPYEPSSVKWTTEKFAQGDKWGLSALLVLR